MSNTCLPTTKNPIYTSLKRGDIVNARGQLGVIVDHLKSSSTDASCLYISFVHNLGNSRDYDMLELTPARAKALGVDKWTLATQEELSVALDSRLEYIKSKGESLLRMVGC